MEKDLKVNVIAKIELEGVHRWANAAGVFPEVGFLSHVHRHKWFITAKKKVRHDDRDVEFILFGRDIREYLNHQYYNETARTHDFEEMSCEMLAREILEEFDCCYVSVFEDNENGAEVYE